MSLTKDEFLAGNLEARWKARKVSTPELGDTGHVFVRALTAGEMGALNELLIDSDATMGEKLASSADLCAFFACDEDGERLFDASDRERLLALTPNEFKAVDRVATAGLDYNGFAGDLEGNSESIPPDDSPSD